MNIKLIILLLLVHLSTKATLLMLLGCKIWCLKHIVVGADKGCFNCQLEDCFQKVFCFVIASYLKFQKCKVSNEVQSNKINRGASTAVSVYFLHITKWDATVKILFYKQILCAFQGPQHVPALPQHSRKHGKKQLCWCPFWDTCKDNYNIYNFYCRSVPIGYFLAFLFKFWIEWSNYSRHGQIEARGPQAALQLIFAALGPFLLLWKANHLSPFTLIGQELYIFLLNMHKKD